MSTYLLKDGVLQSVAGVPTVLSPSGILGVFCTDSGFNPWAIGAGSDTYPTANPSLTFTPSVSPVTAFEMYFNEAADSMTICMEAKSSSRSALLAVTLNYYSGGEAWLSLTISPETDGFPVSHVFALMDSGNPLVGTRATSLRWVDGGFFVVAGDTVLIAITAAQINDQLTADALTWDDSTPFVYSFASFYLTGAAAGGDTAIGYTTSGDMLTDILYDGTGLIPAEFWTNFIGSREIR